MMPAEKESYDSTYVFSADRQEEVKAIYQKYASAKKKPRSAEDEKMEQLRHLDRSVAQRGTIAALLTTVCGAVTHACGIAMMESETMFAPGTVIAILGLAVFLGSYPAYCLAAGRQRRRVEAQILQLCRELMK